MSDGGGIANPLKHVLRELGPAARRYYEQLDQGILSTTWCEGCGRPHFPPRERCAACGGAVEWRELSGRGTVYAFTQQERGLRFMAPAVIGIAELEEGVRVFGLFEERFEELAIGAPVDVELRPDDAGLTLLVFRVRPD
jgi:uncharacterized OB-fold protein